MKQFSSYIILLAASLINIPTSTQANSGDFSGGVAVGTSYAGVSTAPTNGLIAQGAVGIGTTSPSNTLEVSGTAQVDSNLLVGLSSAQQMSNGVAYTPAAQVAGTSGVASFMASRFSSSSNTGGHLVLAHSRGASIGTQTSLQTGDDIGFIDFGGSDGSIFQTAAEISGIVNGSVSSGVVPGALQLSVANSSGTLSPAIFINSSGSVAIGTTSPIFQMQVAQDMTYPGDITPGSAQLSLTGVTVPQKRINIGYDTSSAQTNGFGYIAAGYQGTAWTNLALQPSGGAVGIGITSPVNTLQVGQDLTFNANYPAINFNLNNNNTVKYITSNSASFIDQDYTNNGLAFWTAPLGTAGNTAVGATRLFISGSGGVGIGTTSPRGGSTLDVNGKVYVATFASGSSTAVCQNANVLSSCTSASRFKENVEPSDIGLKEVLAMKPVTFDLRDHRNNWERHDFGFIAEDMERISPLFVTYDENGEINGVRYMQLTAVNAKAIQELYGIIADQKNLVASQQEEIDELKRRIDRLDQPQ